MTLQVEHFADDMQKAGLVMSPSRIKERSCAYSEVLVLTDYCSEYCKVALLFPFKITVAMDTVVTFLLHFHDKCNLRQHEVSLLAQE